MLRHTKATSKRRLFRRTNIRPFARRNEIAVEHQRAVSSALSRLLQEDVVPPEEELLPQQWATPRKPKEAVFPDALRQYDYVKFFGVSDSGCATLGVSRKLTEHEETALADRVANLDLGVKSTCFSVVG